MKVKFIKDYSYEAYPKTGKVTKTVKKGTKKDLIEIAARNLIRRGIAEEIS